MICIHIFRSDLEQFSEYFLLPEVWLVQLVLTFDPWVTLNWTDSNLQKLQELFPLKRFIGEACLLSSDFQGRLYEMQNKWIKTWLFVYQIQA